MNGLNLISRRSMLTRVIPGAALAGLGILNTGAFAQESVPAAVSQASGSDENDSTIKNLIKQAFENEDYQLPELPYGYDALEPHISSRLLEIHHDKHHSKYVDVLNDTLDKLADIQQEEEIDMPRLSGLQRDLSFNAGGHFLHTLFWATMAPNAGGKPQGEIAEAINRHFSSFEAFKNYFSKVAGGVKGSGWALLCYEFIGDQLMVFQVGDHDLQLSPGVLPLLPLDLWEHAYHMQYENQRDRFIDAWWNLINWPAVNESYIWVRSRFME